MSVETRRFAAARRIGSRTEAGQSTITQSLRVPGALSKRGRALVLLFPLALIAALLLPNLAAAAPAGQVAAYSFDEGSGATVGDKSGKGNNGSISGAAWSKTGKSGGALSFDGVNDLVTIADSSSLRLSSGMTLEGWVKPSSLGSVWRTVLLKEQSGQLAYALYAHNGGDGPSGHVYVGDDMAAGKLGSLSTTAWTHLATTYDGKNLVLYVNGVKANTTAVSGAIASSTGSLRIGGNNVWGEWFKGLIDDVRVYNRALSATEITTDMKTPVSGSTSTAPAPLAAPTGVTATQATQSSISIAWNPSSNAAVTSYGVYKDGVKAGDTSSTAYTVSGLSCGTSYTLGVDSADSFGSRSATRTSVSASTAACPTAQPDTEAPAVPGGMLTTGATTSAISLAWNATTDNVGVAGYNLYKNGVKVGSTQSTSYTFSGLTCGTGYTLALTAYDAAGNESNAAYATTDETTSACTTPLPGDTQAPTAPSGLAVSTAGQTSIAVSWNASSDNVGVTGYSAYRNGSSAGSTSTTGYTFSGLTCGTSYTLAVDATDAAGNRSGKSTVTASTSACSSGGGGGGGTSTATVFVSPSGNDGNACSQSAPCKSFDRAYKVAKPGQVVELAGGLYPQQFVYSDSSKTSTDDVVFRPAAGATVTVDCATTSTVGGGTIGGQSCIDVYASHITFDGGSSKSLKTQTYSVSGFSYQGRVDTERGATDITFRNMDVGAYAIGSSQTTISHNDIGPSVDPLNNRQASGNANVWQDNLIHDYPIKNGGHFECVTWDGGTNITFEYNEFRSCAVYAIFAKAVDNISGSVDHNAFWNPMNLTTQADFYPSTGSGATRCDVAATNNWTSEGITLNCPGATESGNTTHDPNVQPPSPIRP